LIERLRVARPDILLTSDFIAGFPEETEQDFEDTLALIREVKFGAAYTFKYSARPGTPAAERPCLPDEVADERLYRLQELINQMQRASLDSMVGKDVNVLFEKVGRKHGQMVGKSDHLHAVHITADEIKVGDLKRVRVTGAGPNSLSAILM